MDNLYNAESFLLARAKAKIPEARVIANLSALTGDVGALIDPVGIFLRPMGFRQNQHANGRDPELILPWAFVVVVPHLSGIDTPETTSLRAGDYIARLIRYFAGYRPPELPLGNLILAGSQPDPNFELSGRAEFPVLFETKFTIESDPQ